MRDVLWSRLTERSRFRARRLVVATLVLALGPANSALADPGAITTLAVSPRDGTLWVGAAEGLFRSEGFCSEPHAEEFAREVAATVAAQRAER